MIPALSLVVFAYTFGLIEPEGSIVILLVRAFGGALVVLGLSVPRLARSSWLWVAVSLLMAVLLGQQWPGSDNHHYLLGIWSIALVLALSQADPRAALAASGRSLVGLAMALATAQKLASADYLDGRMFRSMLLFDPDLRGVAQAIGGLSEIQVSENLRALASLTPTAIVEPAILTQLAWGATWWTLGIEATLALLFLLPPAFAVARARHAVLLLFGLTTYALTPVVGFGFILLTMGLADTEPEQKGLRLAYLAVLAFVWISHTLRFFSPPLGVI